MLPVQINFSKDSSANFVRSDADCVQSAGQIVPSSVHSVAFRDTVPVSSVVAGATSTLSASIKGSPQQKRQPDLAFPSTGIRRGVGRRRLLPASSSGRQLTIESLICKERSSWEPYVVSRHERASDDAGRSAACPSAGAAVPVATGPAARCDSRPRAALLPTPGIGQPYDLPTKKPALCPTPAHDVQASSADVITASTSVPTGWRQVGGKRSMPLDHQRPHLISCAAAGATAISVTAAGAVSKQQLASMGRGAAVSAKSSSTVTAARLDYGIVENLTLGGSRSSSRDGIASLSSHTLNGVDITSKYGAGSGYSTVSSAAVWQPCASAKAMPHASAFAPGTIVEEVIIISDDDESSDLVEEVVVTEAVNHSVPNSKQDCSENKIANVAASQWPDIEAACETRRTPDRMVEGDEMIDREPCRALDRSQTTMSTEQGDSSVQEPQCQDEVATCPEVVDMVKLEVTSLEDLSINDVHGPEPLPQPEAGCHPANEGVDENSEMEVYDDGHEMEGCSRGIQKDGIYGGHCERDGTEKGNDICVPPQDDSDDDLMLPAVDLGTNSSLNKTEDMPPRGLLKDGEFLLNGQVCSFPKLYTIDVLCELHREREKAQQELVLAQERITSSNFQTAFQAAFEKSDDVDMLTEEQQALADKMSLPASVLRDRHPGCSFINSHLQQHLFSESTCHLCFESVLSVEDEKLQLANSVRNTPLGDYCYLRIVLANGGLHTLLMLAPDTSAALDYAFWLMSCHSNTRVVDGIRKRILDLDQMSCRPPTAADTAKKWYPSAALFIGVLSNYGLDPKLAFAQDESLSATFHALLKNAGTVASADSVGAAGPLEPPNCEINVPWPKSQNFEAVLAVVRHTAETRQVYTDSEIETMLLSAIILALDTRATEWSVDLEMSRFVAALLAALHENSWRDKASAIVGRLATLLSRCHHHTCLHALEFFTLNKSEAVPFCRHRLAFAILTQLLFGSMETKDLRHMKVGMLINIEKSILPPVGFANVDLYLTSTLLRLLWHSIPLWALDKAELADLRLIYTSLKEKERRIRSSLRSIDIMEVKHLIFLMTCMWSGVLHNSENQEALFYKRDICDYAKRPMVVEKVAAHDDPCRE